MSSAPEGHHSHPADRCCVAAEDAEGRCDWIESRPGGGPRHLVRAAPRALSVGGARPDGVAAQHGLHLPRRPLSHRLQGKQVLVFIFI